MKGKDVEIGGRYRMMVSGKLVECTVLSKVGRTSGFGVNLRYFDAWMVRNERTGRVIKVKSAQRLRPLHPVKEERRVETAIKPVREVDSLIRDNCNANLLKWACGYAISCPVCGDVLDCSRAVLLKSPAVPVCIRCLEELVERVRENNGATVDDLCNAASNIIDIDGRTIEWDMVVG